MSMMTDGCGDHIKAKLRGHNPSPPLALTSTLTAEEGTGLLLPGKNRLETRSVKAKTSAIKASL